MHLGSYATITSMLIAAAAASRRKTTPEERARLEEERERKRAIEIRQAQIIRNECPSCSGKLVRGKKERTHNYQRGWSCQSCSKVHYQ